MKLMICGKGGSGKSTITALLARQYAAMGRRVLVVDTDMSNVGLHRILGTPPAADFTGFFGGKGGRRRSAGPRPPRDPSQPPPPRRAPPPPPPAGTWTYDKLPEGYSAEHDGIKLVSIGKITDADQFGKGYWTGMACRFLSGLGLAGDDIALIDVEAGVEHLDRGLGRACDLLLMVTEPSFESIRLSNTVAKMVGPEGVPVYFVLNKIDPQSAALVREGLPASARIVGEFPCDNSVLLAGLEGRAFPAGHPAAMALIECIGRIVAPPRG